MRVRYAVVNGDPEDSGVRLRTTLAPDLLKAALTHRKLFGSVIRGLGGSKLVAEMLALRRLAFRR